MTTIGTRFNTWMIEQHQNLVSCQPDGLWYVDADSLDGSPMCSSEAWVEVRVKVIKHATRRDTVDSRSGRIVSRDRAHWEWVSHHGRRVWAWQQKKKTYFTRQESKQKDQLVL